MTVGLRNEVSGAETLAEILKPYAPEEFLASFWGVNFLHARAAAAGRFARLMPWETLNEILRRGRLDFPRLRLVKDGKPLPVSEYLRHVAAVRRRASIPRLKTSELTKHLREGATLVLDAVDELHEPLEQLAAGLELFFREHVQINLYAGWQTSRGFDLHWDDHDVFILQVMGRKRWSVYGQTRPFPLVADVEKAEKPTREPLWEGTLEDGDLLYIPRGWWHVAQPLAETTLHLTVGIHNRTGLDLLRWLTERMRASEAFRRDLPRMASSSELSAHVARMREELLAEMGDALLERFYDDMDAQAEPRARPSLPWGATTELMPSDGRAVVRLVAPRPLKFEEADDAVEFSALKRRWRFKKEALLILRPLAERRACTIAELCAGARGALDAETVRALVRELLLHGFVSVSEG
ncbi:MAG TPA: cupin domain-containing protein [Pyrinomonadaceae bacterium]|nr:cupin domain-containing protein [Pyrinomonadaceae bacterium]